MTAASDLLDDQQRKQFETLAARFALRGHALIRSQPGDAQAPFYAMRWGWLKPMASLEAAERFLVTLEGPQ